MIQEVRQKEDTELLMRRQSCDILQLNWKN